LSSVSTASQNFAPSTLLEPEAEHVAFAVEVDADRHVAGLVADGAAVADLHDQRVEEQDRVDVLERSCLPLPDVVEHGVGDPRDQVVADLDAVQLGQVRLDVAHAHPAPVQRDDLIVEAVEAALMLPDDLRCERALAVTRLLDLHRPVRGVHGLGAEAVAGVAGATRRRLPSLITEVFGQLGIHRPLHQPLGQPAEQTALAGDLFRRPGAGEQLVNQLVGRMIRIKIRGDDRHRLLGNLLGQRGLLSERPTPLSSDHAYTGNRTDPTRLLTTDTDGFVVRRRVPSFRFEF